MKTIYLSHTELESLSKFWDLYVKKDSDTEEVPDPALQVQMDRVLTEVSFETREIFLNALDEFELQGEEFQVRVAPDDAKLVSA